MTPRVVANPGHHCRSVCIDDEADVVRPLVFRPGLIPGRADHGGPGQPASGFDIGSPRRSRILSSFASRRSIRSAMARF